MFTDETVAFVDDFADEQLERVPRGAAHRVEHRHHRQLPDRRSRAPRSIPPTGERRRGRLRRRAARHPASAPPTSTPSALNLIFRTGAGVARGAGRGRQRDPRHGRRRRRASSATPSGLAVVGVGLLENLEANRVLLTYLAILFVFLFLAVRLRSVVRSLLSLVPVLIAVGAASLVAGPSASSSAR